MNLYRVYLPSVSEIKYVTAVSRIMAVEMAKLIYCVESEENFYVYRTSTVYDNKVSDVGLLLEEVGIGYFDQNKPATFKYDSCTWYPFVSFTVRGHFIDLALKELEHESV